MLCRFDTLRGPFAVGEKLYSRNLSVIKNAGPNNLKVFALDALDEASSVVFGAAFIMSAGVENLLDKLMDALSRGPVRLLTSLYQSVTEPKSIAFTGCLIP